MHKFLGRAKFINQLGQKSAFGRLCPALEQNLEKINWRKDPTNELHITGLTKIKTSSFLYISRFTTPQLELQCCVLSHTPYGGGGDKVMVATTCRILKLVQEQLPWEKGRFSQRTVQTWKKCLEKNAS